MRLRLLATTPEQKRIGLAAVPYLENDEYALFVYNTPNVGGYWNKNVQYPIDIGFYDSGKNLIYKTSMEANQRAPVYSPLPYSYVIETNKNKLSEKFAF